jgi:hypothetical protein
MGHGPFCGVIKMWRLRTILTACILSVTAGAAKADVIQAFDVSGTDRIWVSTVVCSPASLCPVFSPGTFSGHLTVDFSTNTVLAANIIAGSQIPSQNWTLLTPSVLPDISLPNTFGFGTMSLFINLANNTVAGATNGPNCSGNGGCAAYISQMEGTLTPSVPEPATWAMLLIGFAGIGAMSYRRKRAHVLNAPTTI